MKKFVVIVFAVVVLISSCKKKEPKGEDCFDTPENTSISSTDSLLNKVVDVEWSISDGRSDHFTTIVSQSYRDEKNYLKMSINGWFGSTTAAVFDQYQPSINVEFSPRGVGIPEKISWIGAHLSGEHLMWLPKGRVGLYEDNNTITIIAYGIQNQSDENLFMCVKLTIHRH